MSSIINFFSAVLLTLQSIFVGQKSFARLQPTVRKLRSRNTYLSTTRYLMGGAILLFVLNLSSPIQSNIVVTVNGLESKNASQLCLEVQNEAQFLGTQSISNKKIPLEKGKNTCVVELPNLPGNQKVALILFQDLNRNNQLDKDKFGIPIEPYGFSKNVKVRFSPPKFSEVAIVTQPGAQTLKVNMARWSLH